MLPEQLEPRERKATRVALLALLAPLDPMGLMELPALQAQLEPILQFRARLAPLDRRVIPATRVAQPEPRALLAWMEPQGHRAIRVALLALLAPLVLTQLFRVQLEPRECAEQLGQGPLEPLVYRAQVGLLVTSTMAYGLACLLLRWALRLLQLLKTYRTNRVKRLGFKVRTENSLLHFQNTLHRAELPCSTCMKSLAGAALRRPLHGP